MSQQATASSTGAPAMIDFTTQITTQFKNQYGTVPSYNPSQSFTILPLQTTGTSNNWQMLAQLGTAKANFGGKTWNIFYYSTQVAFKGTVATGSALQSWVQFLNWDNSATQLKSYYNIASLVNYATVPTSAPTVSCGIADLLSSTATAANNKGATACVSVNPFFGGSNMWDTLATPTGWTTFQTGGVRNFIELPVGTTTPTQLLNIKYGDTVQFLAGFKYYAVGTGAPTAFSSATATAATIATTTSTLQSWTIVDSAVALTLSYTLTTIATMWF